MREAAVFVGRRWFRDSRGASVLTLALCALLTGAPAVAQSGDCLDTECFYSGRVRSFQVVDTDTIVVYAGRDRCAFVVDVAGLFCDVTYLPEVAFVRTRDLILEERTGLSTNAAGPARNDRICPNTASTFSLATFGFTALDDDTPRGRPACELRAVRPASDYDLIELLTNEGIAPPPPPIGSGEITRSENADEPVSAE